MDPIKYIFQNLIQRLKQTCSLPQTVRKAFNDTIEEKQRQDILNKNEAERLDRICNPLKYRGK